MQLSEVFNNTFYLPKVTVPKQNGMNQQGIEVIKVFPFLKSAFKREKMMVRLIKRLFKGTKKHGKSYFRFPVPKIHGRVDDHRHATPAAYYIAAPQVPMQKRGRPFRENPTHPGKHTVKGPKHIMADPFGLHQFFEQWPNPFMLEKSRPGAMFLVALGKGPYVIVVPKPKAGLMVAVQLRQPAAQPFPGGGREGPGSMYSRTKYCHSPASPAATTSGRGTVFVLDKASNPIPSFSSIPGHRSLPFHLIK